MTPEKRSPAEACCAGSPSCWPAVARHPHFGLHDVCRHVTANRQVATASGQRSTECIVHRPAEHGVFCPPASGARSILSTGQRSTECIVHRPAEHGVYCPPASGARSVLSTSQRSTECIVHRPGLRFPEDAANPVTRGGEGGAWGAQG